MKWSVVVLLVLSVSIASIRTVTANENGNDAEDTTALADLVQDMSEAEMELSETSELESEVDAADVNSEHSELTAELESEAMDEFETETEDEVVADATAQDADEVVDEEAIDSLDADETEEEISTDDEEEDEADSFISESEDMTIDATESAEAEAEAEAETESESERTEVVAGAALLSFEEDNADDAADEAEEAEAIAEEQANAMRFKAKPVEYDEQMAKEALVYAQAAYYEADPAHCASKLGHTGFELKHSVQSELRDGSSVFGMTAVDKSKKRVIVAFNGNVTPKDLTSALMRGKPLKLKSLCKSCKTHPYYVIAYRKICPEITASVRMLLNKKSEFRNYEIMITGHGFGGALAALCGYELEMARVFRHVNKRHFITFGQPRFGNSHMARKFQQFFPNAIRVTHSDDPYPHVPPCHVNPLAAPADAQTCFELKDRKKKLWAYHNPTQIWYSGSMPSYDSQEKGTYKICNGPNWGEDPTCRRTPLGFSIDDHRNYFGVDVSSHCANLIDPPQPSADSKAGADSEDDLLDD